MGHKVEAGPERIRYHIPRPHPNKMITDQIRSTVYLIDPTRHRNLVEECRRWPSPGAGDAGLEYGKHDGSRCRHDVGAVGVFDGLRLTQ